MAWRDPDNTLTGYEGKNQNTKAGILEKRSQNFHKYAIGEKEMLKVNKKS